MMIPKRSRHSGTGIRFRQVLQIDFVEKAAHGFLQTSSVQAAHLIIHEEAPRDTTCCIHDRNDNRQGSLGTDRTQTKERQQATDVVG